MQALLQCSTIQRWSAFLFLQTIVCCLGQNCAADETSTTAKYGPEVRTITVAGTIDPRLYASVRTTYRPTEYNEKDNACTRSDWNTGRHKGMLDWQFERIKPDENNRYKVIIPIDYVRENPCGYEYVDTSIHVRRDERDDQYANITLLSGSKKNYDTYGSKGKNWPDDANVQSRKTTKPYYRLAHGSHIQCHTDYFESTQDVLFNCYPLGGDGDHGVDELTTTNMQVDIRINEEISEYIFDSRIKPGSKKDHFRDYVLPPPSLFERLKQGIEKLLN